MTEILLIILIITFIINSMYVRKVEKKSDIFHKKQLRHFEIVEELHELDKKIKLKILKEKNE